MDMENGDQVTKRGYLCPQESRGEVTPITPLIYATEFVILKTCSLQLKPYFRN